MKHLLITLILSLFTITSAQYHIGPEPVKDVTFDSTTHYLKRCSSDSQGIEKLIEAKLIHIFYEDELGRIRKSYWDNIGPYEQKAITINMARYCGNINKNYKYTFTLQSWPDTETVATYTTPPEAIRSYAEDEKAKKREEDYQKEKKRKETEDIKMDMNKYPQELIHRLEYDKRIIFYNGGVIIVSSLWEGWDDQMKENMIILLSLYRGNKYKDYSYKTNFKILSLKEPYKSFYELPVFKTFEKPEKSYEFANLIYGAYNRFTFDYLMYDTSNYYELVQGEENKVSMLMSNKELLVDHEERTAFIQPIVWNGLSPKEQKILATIIAIKCGNECGDYNYKIYLKDMKTKKIVATYHNNKCTL